MHVYFDRVCIYMYMLMRDEEGRKKQARSNKQQVYMYMCTLHPSVCRGPFHRERRRYLRTALSELHQLLGDSPGLCGPKVHVYTYVLALYLAH